VPDHIPHTAEELRGWLRDLKDQSGSSFSDIARAIGEEERVVKRWMTVAAKPSIPRGDALLRLLDYFDVKLTPPAPRDVALSLMGEIREVQETVRRLESGSDGAERKSLPEIDQRLEKLVDEVAEAVELLKPLAARQGRDGVSRRRGKAAS
jgi:transcriptional regulator with XRE-family HTH domain